MKKVDPSRGQRAHKCDIVGCNEFGRTLARLGGLPIYYCPKHRKKYGERIINAMINSLFNHKLSQFMIEVKQDIFFNKEDLLCEECATKVNDYIKNKTIELDKILDYAEENEMKIIDEDEVLK